MSVIKGTLVYGARLLLRYGRLVQKLLSEHRHTHTHAHRTDSFSWTTTMICKNVTFLFIGHRSSISRLRKVTQSYNGEMSQSSNICFDYANDALWQKILLWLLIYFLSSYSPFQRYPTFWSFYLFIIFTHIPNIQPLYFTAIVLYCTLHVIFYQLDAKQLMATFSAHSALLFFY